MANHPESIREHPDRRKKTPNREEVRRESGGGWGRKETHLPDFKNIEKNKQNHPGNVNMSRCNPEDPRKQKKGQQRSRNCPPNRREREREKADKNKQTNERRWWTKSGGRD